MTEWTQTLLILERKIDQLAFQSVTIAEANDVQTYDLHAVRIRHLTHYHLMLLSLAQKSRNRRPGGCLDRMATGFVRQNLTTAIPDL